MSDSSQPLVSVIITTYNRCNKVFNCLESVLNQEYENLEVIVVDDCSTDQTQEKFAAYFHPQVVYVRHQSNKKVAAATNTGFRHSKGKYIAAIGDDDIWTDRLKLKKQVRIFEEDSEEKFGVVTCGVRKVKEKGSIVITITRPKNLLEHFLIRNSIIYGSAALVRRKAWEDVGGFDECHPKGTDSDLYRRIIIKGFDVYFMRDVMIDYDDMGQDRMTLTSSLKSIDTTIESIEFVLRKHSKEFKLFPRALSIRYCQLANLNLRGFTLSKEQRYLQNGLCLATRALKTRITMLGIRTWIRLITAKILRFSNAK